MERLTYYENGLARYDFGGVQYQNAIATRLAAYEDTGLEPEDIKELCTDDMLKTAKMLKKMIETGEVDHLIDLLKAEADGRLLVLPCKVGDTVYIGNRYFAVARVTAIYIDGAGGMFDLDVRSDIETATGFKHYICKDYTFEDIGKSVFLTREEAEKALKEVRE